MELWDLYDKDRKPLNRTHVRGEAFAEGEYYVSLRFKTYKDSLKK